MEAAWAVVDRVLDHATPVHPYEQGRWGPDKAESLMDRHGGWHDPTPSKTKR